ncbi:hypothetical protein QJS04_geneDACA021973 [Acorus gramineus]|uniref:Uncharacterized protein n=1 Tax=Acorus gramineus TaxID=55184 RepID=A0AAV9A982_ACOGR|nr:hypothetical protein QJS04_geneDACA021973 [Acorus gramineus]
MSINLLMVLICQLVSITLRVTKKTHPTNHTSHDKLPRCENVEERNNPHTCP